MIMKFVTTALLLLNGVHPHFSVSVNSSTSTLRGGKISKMNNEWDRHPTDDRRRRLKMESTDDCLLVLKAIDYENHEKDTDLWACEFQQDFAEKQLNGNEFIDIDIPKVIIDELNPTSGGSILKTRDAFVEKSLDTKQMTIHIPQDGKIEVEHLDESHERHYKQRRTKQLRALRSLADSSPGELSVLVVRVVDSNGSAGSTESQLIDDIFTDEFSLKTAYSECSKDQLIVQPATGSNKINQGVLTVSIDVEASAGPDILGNSAFQAASSELGGLSQWDLVMFCQPPNGSWIAYAYINSWASFYNGRWCSSVSTQMHEVGHNLGLGHSNEPGQSYGDQSSMMGYSYDMDNGPRMCFNAAKNFQLGWYERQKESFYPLSNKNKVVDFVFNGVNEYKTSGDTEGKLITLRIATNLERDYYVGFNDAFGVNSGTLEGRNQVLIFEKLSGGPDSYGESDRVAALSVGDSFTITNFGNEEFDLIIKFDSSTNGGRDANVEISTGVDGPLSPPMEPTLSPTPEPTTKGPVTGTESPTSVPETKPPVAEPTISPTPEPTTKEPVPVPTYAPTAFDDGEIDLTPTAAPTSTCPEDSKVVVFKLRKGKPNRNKKCGWIKLGKTLEVRKKRCELKHKGKKVKVRCPRACGKFAGAGICSFLWKEDYME